MMIEAIQKKLEQENKAACIAVTDSHGELIAFLRMDHSRITSLYIAMNKAFTAAREQKGSGEVGASSRTDGFPMSNFGDIRFNTWAGGVPVVSKGEVIGAIGVSGLTEEEDLALATMAAKLLK